MHISIRYLWFSFSNKNRWRSVCLWAVYEVTACRHTRFGRKGTLCLMLCTLKTDLKKFHSILFYFFWDFLEFCLSCFATIFQIIKMNLFLIPYNKFCLFFNKIYSEFKSIFKKLITEFVGIFKDFLKLHGAFSIFVKRIQFKIFSLM